MVDPAVDPALKLTHGRCNERYDGSRQDSARHVAHDHVHDRVERTFDTKCVLTFCGAQRGPTADREQHNQDQHDAVHAMDSTPGRTNYEAFDGGTFAVSSAETAGAASTCAPIRSGMFNTGILMVTPCSS